MLAFFKYPSNQKGLTQIFLIIFLLIGLVVSVYAVQYARTVFNPKAYNTQPDPYQIKENNLSQLKEMREVVDSMDFGPILKLQLNATLSKLEGLSVEQFAYWVSKYEGLVDIYAKTGIIVKNDYYIFSEDPSTKKRNRGFSDVILTIGWPKSELSDAEYNNMDSVYKRTFFTVDPNGTILTRTSQIGQLLLNQEELENLAKIVFSLDDSSNWVYTPIDEESYTNDYISYHISNNGIDKLYEIYSNGIVKAIITASPKSRTESSGM